MEGVAKGAYTVHGGEGSPDVIVIATGALLSLTLRHVALCQRIRVKP